MKIENISSKTIDFFKKHGERFVCVIGATVIMSSTPKDAIAKEYDQKVFTRQKNGTKIEVMMKENNDRLLFSVENGYNISELEFEDLEKIVGDLLKQILSDMNQNEMIFTITTPWVKSSRYNVTTPTPPGPKKQEPIDNLREYTRIIYTIKPNDSFNFDYFAVKNIFDRLQYKSKYGIQNGVDLKYDEILEYFVDGDSENVFDIIDEKVETIEVDEKEEKELNSHEYTMNVNDNEITFTIETKEFQEEKLKKDLYIAVPLTLIVASIMIYAYSKHGIMAFK